MNKAFEKLSDVACEAYQNDIIDEETAVSIVEFCESAQEDNMDDISAAKDIVDSLSLITESADTPSENDLTEEDVVNAILESEENGEITEEERDFLVSLM